MTSVNERMDDKPKPIETAQPEPLADEGIIFSDSQVFQNPVAVRLIELIDTLKHDPNALINLSKLAQEVGVSRQRVTQIIKEIEGKSNLVVPREHRAEKTTQIEEIAKLHAKGLTIDQAAAQLTLSPGYIRKLSKGLSLQWETDKQRQRQKRNNLIVTLKGQGLKNNEIASQNNFAIGLTRNIATDAANKGFLTRERGKRRTKEAINLFNDEVKKLRDANFTEQQIAEKLKCPEHFVERAIRELLRTNKTTRIKAYYRNRPLEASIEHEVGLHIDRLIFSCEVENRVRAGQFQADIARELGARKSKIVRSRVFYRQVIAHGEAKRQQEATS